MSYLPRFHPSALLPVWISLAIGATAGRGLSQGDLETRIAELAQLVQNYNADIVRLRNSVSGIGDAHRQQAAIQIATIQDQIRGAIGKQRQAQKRIDDCSNSCDVVVAQRNGLPVTQLAMANHNRELADARFALREAQQEEQQYRTQLAPMQEKASAVPPAEAEVIKNIVHLTTEVRNHEAALFTLRSQRSQQQLQETIRRSVEELTRPKLPVPAAAVASSGTAPQAKDASAQAAQARRSLSELARKVIGDGEPGAAQIELLDALPKRPKPAVAPIDPTAAAPAPAALDVDELLSPLPARSPTPTPTPPPTPAPAPAVEPRPVGGRSFGLDGLRPDTRLEAP